MENGRKNSFFEVNRSEGSFKSFFERKLINEGKHEQLDELTKILKRAVEENQDSFGDVNLDDLRAIDSKRKLKSKEGADVSREQSPSSKKTLTAEKTREKAAELVSLYKKVIGGEKDVRSIGDEKEKKFIKEMSYEIEKYKENDEYEYSGKSSLMREALRQCVEEGLEHFQTKRGSKTKGAEEVSHEEKKSSLSDEHEKKTKKEKEDSIVAILSLSAFSDKSFAEKFINDLGYTSDDALFLCQTLGLKRQRDVEVFFNYFENHGKFKESHPAKPDFESLNTTYVALKSAGVKQLDYKLIIDFIDKYCSSYDKTGQDAISEDYDKDSSDTIKNIKALTDKVYIVRHGQKLKLDVHGEFVKRFSYKKKKDGSSSGVVDMETGRFYPFSEMIDIQSPVLFWIYEKYKKEAMAKAFLDELSDENKKRMSDFSKITKIEDVLGFLPKGEVFFSETEEKRRKTERENEEKEDKEWLENRDSAESSVFFGEPFLHESADIELNVGKVRIPNSSIFGKKIENSKNRSC